MRKLAPARVSYRDEFLISYRVYIMTGSFHIWLFYGTLHVDKIHVYSKSQTLRVRYPFQSTGRPISHRNRWKFRVYMIPLRDFVPEWNSRPGTRTGVNSRRGDSRQHDILSWYHVNKYRGHEREPEWNRSWAKVAPVSCKLRNNKLKARPDVVWTKASLSERRYFLLGVINHPKLSVSQF